MSIAVALDLGTTTIKAGLLSKEGVLGNIVARSAPNIVAEGGRYESDAMAYAAVAEAVLADCVGNVSEVPPLGLCSQRSSFLIWERDSGLPVTPLISWQDERGAESCAALRDEESLIRHITGLPLTPYYFAPKLRVLLGQHPEWRARLLNGDWLLGTLDTFLIWRWSQGEHYVTDVSMAARTLLMDIHTRQWSAVLCDLFGVPLRVLPTIRSSTGLGLRLHKGLLLQASLGDQSAALADSIVPGQPEALVNLGTGGFAICHLPENRHAPEDYLQTVARQDAGGHMYLACEGTLNSIAAALAPYPVQTCHIEDLAADNILCLAEPSGLGAPYFRGDLGLTFSAPVEHVPPQRIAVLLQEGIIFRVTRMLEDFRRELGIERAYLAGGLSALPCLRQGIAGCVPLAVYGLSQADASLRGAARLAAGQAWAGSRHADRIEVPQKAQALRAKYLRWKDWLDGLLRTPSEGGTKPAP